MTQLYRLLTGLDDASFCHKVSKAISDGWELYGPPTMAVDPKTGNIICGQAVIKQSAERYNDAIPLSQQ